jgi:hypothetical protein
MPDLALSWPKRLAAIGILALVPVLGGCEAPPPGEFPEDDMPGFEDTLPDEGWEE